MTSNMMLERVSAKCNTARSNSTYFWRLTSCFDKVARTSSGTRLCHSSLPVGPLPIALCQVHSCATVCSFLIAAMASFRNSTSGLPSAVSLQIASSKTGYFCRCSDGRLRKCFRSSLCASGCLDACYMASHVRQTIRVSNK